MEGLGNVPSPQPGPSKAGRPPCITLPQAHREQGRAQHVGFRQQTGSGPPPPNTPREVISSVSSFLLPKEGNPASSSQLHFGLGLSSRGFLCTPLSYLVQPWSVPLWPVLQMHREALQPPKSELRPGAWASSLSPHHLTQPQEEVGEIMASQLVLSVML